MGLKRSPLYHMRADYYGMFEMYRLVGDCAACRFQENAIQHMKLGASDSSSLQLSDAPSFRVRTAFVCNRQAARAPRGYSEP